MRKLIQSEDETSPKKHMTMPYSITACCSVQSGPTTPSGLYLSPCSNPDPAALDWSTLELGECKVGGADEYCDDLERGDPIDLGAGDKLEITMKRDPPPEFGLNLHSCKRKR